MNQKRRAALWLTLLLCFILFVTPAYALEAAEGEKYQGIDVSRYQEKIDFSEVKKAGIEVVYIRAGQGSTYEDPYFRANARGAREAGLHYGFYLFVTAKSVQQAQQQAQFFHELIQNEGADCRPVMDFEQLRGMSVAQINEVGLAFLQELERLEGVRPILYTNAYTASHVWEESMGAYGLWVANYGVEQPHVPSGPWSAWIGFQYSNTGRVKGIAADVDMDIFVLQDVLAQGKPTPPKQFFQYTVRRGDTLWRLARQFGTTIDEIAQLNGLADPNKIRTGQQLKIPAVRQEEYLSYTVKRGDTLTKLARRYGTTVRRLVQLNGIADANKIYVGQQLRIPTT